MARDIIDSVLWWICLLSTPVGVVISMVTWSLLPCVVGYAVSLVLWSLWLTHGYRRAKRAAGTLQPEDWPW